MDLMHKHVEDAELLELRIEADVGDILTLQRYFTSSLKEWHNFKWKRGKQIFTN